MAKPAIVLRLVDDIATRPSTSSSSSSSSSSSGGTITPWRYAQRTNLTATACPTPRTNDADGKALPLPPVVLEPLRKEETVGGRPRSREEPPPVWLGWLIVLPGLLAFLLSAGMATTLLLYLTTIRGASGDGSGFYVAESADGVVSLRGLLATTSIVYMTWFISTPLLVSLTGYSVASSWLTYQRRPRSLRTDLLTPLQYAILFKILSSPSPQSLFQANSYLADRRRRVQAPAPAFFAHGILLVGSVFGLGYALSLVDVWLHASATAIMRSLPPDGPFLPSPIPAQPHAFYPMAPTITFLLLLYAHSLLALGLTIRVALVRSPVIRFAEREREWENSVSDQARASDAEARLESDSRVANADVTPFPPGLGPSAPPSSYNRTRASTAVTTAQGTPQPAPSLALPTTIAFAIEPDASPLRPTALLPNTTTLSRDPSATSARPTRSISVSTSASRFSSSTTASASVSSRTTRTPRSSSAALSRPTPAVPLAHAQLTDALSPIAALLASPARMRHSAARAAGGLEHALWVEDTNTARVEVGIWRANVNADGGAEKGSSVLGRRRRFGETESTEGVFGVYKKVVPWRGEIY